MKVYTKKGDSGTTQLIGGTRVPKSSIRIEAYGTVDELNAWIGLIRDQEINPTTKKELIEIQDRLFTLGSLLASDPAHHSMKLPEITAADTQFLEEAIDKMEETLDPMRNFILPGGHTTVSYTHIARCVCRRSERIICDLHEHESLEPLILAYVNRLSDYLFVLGRKLAKDLSAAELVWKPRL